MGRASLLENEFPINQLPSILSECVRGSVSLPVSAVPTPNDQSHVPLRDHESVEATRITTG